MCLGHVDGGREQVPSFVMDREVRRFTDSNMIYSIRDTPHVRIFDVKRACTISIWDALHSFLFLDHGFEAAPIAHPRINRKA